MASKTWLELLENTKYYGGINRDLTLPLIDSVFSVIRRNGGQPRLIITSQNQYDRLTRLLQARQRYINTDIDIYAANIYYEGIRIPSYQYIPIVVDPNVSSSDMYILDTDYIMLEDIPLVGDVFNIISKSYCTNIKMQGCLRNLKK